MMRNKKKRTLKGFTLIELIIVMAIVSILMVGVMKVAQPAIKIMNNTSNSEKTYGYTDNIRTYLQTQLEYSDSLWVIPEKELGSVEFNSKRHKFYDSDMHTDVSLTLGSTIDDAVKQFTYENYFKTVSYNGSGSSDVMSQIQPLKGKVNVLRLCNHDHDSFKAGQITLATYNFESYNDTSDYFDSTDINITGSTPETLAINNAYFEAYDTKDYTFSYALGAYDIVGDSTISGAEPTDTFKVIPEDKNDEVIKLANYNDLAVSIILSTGICVDLPGSSYSFRAFQNPSQISVANLPLMNISYHGGNLIGRMYVNEYGKENITDTVTIPQLVKWGKEKTLSKNTYNHENSSNPIQSFCAFLAEDDPTTPDDETQKIDFTEDIYFIYSYATDLE